MPAYQTATPPTDRKSIVPILISALVAFGLATALAMEHQSKLELREEQEAWQRQLDRVTELMAAADRQANVPAAVTVVHPLASGSAGDLLRLRTELGALRQLTNEWENAQKENTEAHAALDRYLTNSAPQVATADFWPQESWNFHGYATPDDAVRSFLWAGFNGNVKAILDSATGDFRQQGEKEFEGKSADEASLRAMDEASNIKSVQVLNRDYQSADTAVLTTEFADGDQSHTVKVVLKKIGNEWKVAGMDH